jgi:hypothetical protein
VHPSHLLPKPHICISACAETAEDDEHEAQGDDEAAAPGGSQAAGQRVRIKRERQEREARQQQQQEQAYLVDLTTQASCQAGGLSGAPSDCGSIATSDSDAAACCCTAPTAGWCLGLLLPQPAVLPPFSSTFRAGHQSAGRGAGSQEAGAGA